MQRITVANPVGSASERHGYPCAGGSSRPIAEGVPCAGMNTATRWDDTTLDESVAISKRRMCKPAPKVARQATERAEAAKQKESDVLAVTSRRHR